MKALLGDYPCTAAFKLRASLAFEDIRPPSAGFKRVVRGLEFDVAELAITTFLMAKAAGKPYRLLPAVVLARMQHSRLVRNAERGPLAPRDLEGRRVGVRSYSVTTGMWIRGILAEDHGVNCDHITWVTFEEAHVAEFRDPANVECAPAGRKLEEMLLAGEIDAAVTGDAPITDPRIVPVIPGAEAAARASPSGVRGVDPETGHYYDDTRRYIDAAGGLSAADREGIYSGNVRRVYPRFERRAAG
ncbi:MAG: hypothetical protein WD775_13050 [Burkholderiales bacterium]